MTIQTMTRPEPVLTRSEQLAQSLAENLTAAKERHAGAYSEALNSVLRGVHEQNAHHDDLHIFLREAEKDFWQDVESELYGGLEEARSDWFDSLDADDQALIDAESEAFAEALSELIDDAATWLVATEGKL